MMKQDNNMTNSQQKGANNPRISIMQYIFTITPHLSQILEEVAAMVQKTVLKVNISCEKCKTNILKAVSGLQGVDKVEVDGTKGTLSVTGDADPYEIIVRTRKAGKFAEVVSIGPPPKPQEKKPEPKKAEEKKTEEKAHQHIHHPPLMCPLCEMAPSFPITRWEEPTPHSQCNIM